VWVVGLPFISILLSCDILMKGNIISKRDQLHSSSRKSLLAHNTSGCPQDT